MNKLIIMLKQKLTNFLRLKPVCPILAVVSNRKIARILTLVGSIIPTIVDKKTSQSDIIRFASQKKLIQKGDFIIFVGGDKALTGSTNTMNIIKI